MRDTIQKDMGREEWKRNEICLKKVDAVPALKIREVVKYLKALKREEKEYGKRYLIKRRLL